MTGKQLLVKLPQSSIPVLIDYKQQEDKIQ